MQSLTWKEIGNVILGVSKLVKICTIFLYNIYVMMGMIIPTWDACATLFLVSILDEVYAHTTLHILAITTCQMVQG